MNFKWHLGGPPPPIEDHSKAKLTVLRSYLRAYFDKLGTNWSREEFKLDLVDGFAGGGTFSDGEGIISGSPLIMLEETEGAQDRLNRNRAKPLHFDCKFYFVDVDAAHTSHLQKTLDERGYTVDDERIVIRNHPFESVVTDIIAQIRGRQPKAGRSLFLLDQCGYSKVELNLVAKILQELPAAEVILTFATDALVNRLADDPAVVQAVTPLDLTAQDVRDLIELNNGDGGKALVQRALRQQIRSVTGATFDTPFFLRPAQSRRTLWFLHLSRHPVARDVMIECHWNNSAQFEHYGSGDFEMLGWDGLKSGTLPLFHFEELDAKTMRKQLLATMPEKLYSLAVEEPVAVETMRHMFANDTAARFSDFNSVLLKLFQEKEFDILNADGKIRSRRLKTLNASDRIATPRMLLLPGISRRRNGPTENVRNVSQKSSKPRPFGLAKGTFSVPPSFFEPLPDEKIAAFEGESK